MCSALYVSLKRRQDLEQIGSGINMIDCVLILEWVLSFYLFVFFGDCKLHIKSKSDTENPNKRKQKEEDWQYHFQLFTIQDS